MPVAGDPECHQIVTASRSNSSSTALVRAATSEGPAAMPGYSR